MKKIQIIDGITTGSDFAKDIDDNFNIISGSTSGTSGSSGVSGTSGSSGVSGTSGSSGVSGTSGSSGLDGSSLTLTKISITGATTLTRPVPLYNYIRCEGASYNLELPESIGDLTQYTIKKINSGTITLVPFSSNTIDGANTKDILSGASIYLIDGKSGYWEIN